jgi:hypothetical protein
VDAGDCDRCGADPRMVSGCGPAGGRALCPACVVDLGVGEVWCDGHRDEGQDALAWLARLPADWAAVVRLWWIATGEVRMDPSVLDLLRSHPRVADVPDLRRALGDAG